MKVIDHDKACSEEWRPGVVTRMLVSATTGSVQLTVFEQCCAPGKGAPSHMHAVEEVLSVVAGRAEVWIEDERAELGAGQSAIVPAGRRHGFTNAGDGELHVRAVLAAPIFEAAYDDLREIPRRWLPGAP